MEEQSCQQRIELNSTWETHRRPPNYEPSQDLLNMRAQYVCPWIN